MKEMDVDKPVSGQDTNNAIFGNGEPAASDCASSRHVTGLACISSDTDDYNP